MAKFGEKFIYKALLPPHSLDLKPFDFYLLGRLKQLVYNKLPKTYDDLKANIQKEKSKIFLKIHFKINFF